MSKLKLLVVGLLSIGMMSCGGGNYNAYFTGSISGTVNSQTVSGTYTMTVKQVGTTAYGNWFMTVPGAYGTLQGTISGTTMTATMTPVNSTLSGVGFTGTFTLSNTTSTVTFSGGSGTTSATGTLTATL